jgi:hypothetical protein
MAEDFEIYKGKTFGSLCKDIVTNSEDKKHQLDVMITDLKEMIKSINDAVMVVPLLKNYYEVSVRNDEQLVKLAAIVQRIVGGAGDNDGDGNMLLTEEEKKQLMTSVESTVKAMEAPIPELDKKKLPKKAE